MSSNLRTLILMLGIVISPAGYAFKNVNLDEAGPEFQELQQLKSDISTIMKITNTPAAGIVLLDNNGPNWVAGLGVLDVDTSDEADENTMFRIGSISKMFIGLAALKLQEEGRLDFNQTLKELLPDLKFENTWEDEAPIRFIHLLEHTSGWEDMHFAEFAMDRGDYQNLAEALNSHPDSRISRWVPGTRFAYSNIGAAVAAHIIEKITGQLFSKYIQDQFFSPLKMETATFFETDDYMNKGVTLYNAGAEQDYWNIAYYPIGSINASPNDMQRLLRFFINRGQTPSQQLLSDKSIERMETPVSNIASIAGVKAGYGLYNYNTGYKDYQVIFRGHNGGMPGALAELSYVPELKSGYVVMVNTSGPAQHLISEKIRKYLLRNHNTKPIQSIPIPKTFSGLEGWYLQINPRMDIARILFDNVSAVHLSSDDQFVYLRSLLSGWNGQHYYAIDDNLLANTADGLPTVALVEDPLEGEVIAVGSAIFKKVTAIQALSPLVITALIFFLSALMLLYSFYWFYGYFKGNISQKLLHQVWLLPILASLTLVSLLLTVNLTGMSFEKWGKVSASSVYIFIATISYAVFSVASLFSIWKARRAQNSQLLYWSASLMSVLHVMFTVYLGHYGLIGVRSWI